MIRFLICIFIIILATQGFATNLLQNPSFENKLARWSTSGGTLSLITTDSVAGNNSASFTASTSNQYVYQSRVIPNGLKNQQCIGLIWYKYPNGNSGDYKMQIYSDSDLLGELELPVVADWLEVFVSFVCPSSGNIEMRIASVSTTPSTIYLDDLYLGKNIKLANIYEDKLVYAAVRLGTSQTMTHDTEQLIPFNTVVADTNGIFNQANNSFIVPIDGYYRVQCTVQQGTTSSAYYLRDSHLYLKINGSLSYGNIFYDIAVTNAAQRYNIISRVLYLNKNDYVQCFSYVKMHNHNQYQIVGSNEGNFKNGTSAEIYLLKSLQKTSSAVSLGTQGWYVYSIIWRAVSNIQNYDYTASSGYFAAADWKLVNHGSSEAKIACDSGDSVGSTCASSNEQLGVEIDFPRAGAYRICFEGSFNVYHKAVSSSYLDVYYTIKETNANGSTVYFSHLASNNSSNWINTTTAMSENHDNSKCAIVKVSSIGKKYFRLHYTARADSVNNIRLLLGPDTGTDLWGYRILVYPLTQDFPQAVALTDFDPTRATNAISATKMGLYTYLSGQNYNGGYSPTISGTNVSSTIRGIFIPYQTYSGGWRLKGNFSVVFSTGTASGTMSINGVLTKNVSDYFQSCSITPLGGSFTSNGRCYFDPNSSTLTFNMAGASATQGSVSFDIELETKPTWAY